jgi:type I site-specific restriction endonuclease
MSITLREYQKEIVSKGIKILEKHKIVYLSMEVRTGKTLTALSIANGYKNILFVTKKKAISSIQSDYNLLSPNYEIVIINYESIHKIEGDFDLVIVDEAHGLGAFPKASNRVLNLFKKCKNKPIIYLSGTPTPESYSQIFHQFKISSYSPFKQYTTFYKWANHYVNIDRKMIAGNYVNDYSNANKEKIDEHCKKLFISYTQKEAGFNQTINERILKVKMNQTTKKIIKKLIKDEVVQGENEVILADTPVKMQQKIHQLSSGTIKFESGNFKVIDYSKCEYIKDNFKEQKIAIFYKFKAEFEALKETFPLWTNDIEEFNTNKESVFLTQILSGREGINLSVADSLIFYNIDFSATSYFQARDRLTSKTRTKENNVFWLFSIGGIENKIYKCVKNKEDYTLNHFRNDRSEIAN